MWFQNAYKAVSLQCRQFAVALLDECRTSNEVELLLKQSHSAEEHSTAPGGVYPRLRLAINYEQKEVCVREGVRVHMSRRRCARVCCVRACVWVCVRVVGRLLKQFHSAEHITAPQASVCV